MRFQTSHIRPAHSWRKGWSDAAFAFSWAFPRVVVVYHGYGGKAKVLCGIDELEKLIHPRDGHRKIFVMLELYLDESGIHDNAKACVIAGYYGIQDDWRNFETRWNELLASFKIAPEEVRAKDVLKRHGAKWTLFVSSALATIIQSRIHPVAFGIFVEDFFTFSLEQRKFFTGAVLDCDKAKILNCGSPDKPYFMPFQQCVRNVGKYAPSDGFAHFFMGLGRPFSGIAMELYGQLVANPEMPYRERLGVMSCPLAVKTPGLQAADFLAYLMREHMERRENHPEWETRADLTLELALQGLLSIDDLVYYDAECLTKFLALIPPI